MLSVNTLLALTLGEYSNERQIYKIKEIISAEYTIAFCKTTSSVLKRTINIIYIYIFDNTIKSKSN